MLELFLDEQKFIHPPSTSVQRLHWLPSNLNVTTSLRGKHSNPAVCQEMVSAAELPIKPNPKMLNCSFKVTLLKVISPQSKQKQNDMKRVCCIHQIGSTSCICTSRTSESSSSQLEGFAASLSSSSTVRQLLLTDVRLNLQQILI